MEQIYRNLYDKMTPGCYVEIEFEHGDVSIFHFSNGVGEMESNWEPSEEKYGGGALGSQNFIGKDEYLKKKAQKESAEPHA